MSDFIIDILVGSAESDIRDTALEQFYMLSQTETTGVGGAWSGASGLRAAGDGGAGSAPTQTPLAFMLTTLLQARLPFWVTTSTARGPSAR